MSRSINQFSSTHAGAAVQNAYGASLPNFRNLGIVLRILLGVHVAVVFAVVMIGGLGNPLGPIIAGIAIGIAESLTMAITAPAWAPLVSFSLLIAVLLLRPDKI